MRRGAPVSSMVGLWIGTAVAFLAILGRFGSEGFDGERTGLGFTIAVGVFVVGMLAALWFARPRDGALWDLDQRTITDRQEVIGFDGIHRVIVCTGARGYYGLLFFGADGPMPRLSIRVDSRKQPPPTAWRAVRELLASPHAPSLEGYGTPRISAKNFVTSPPISATRGSFAVKILDAQIGWIDQGGDPRASGAPIEAFRVSGHHGS